MYRHSVASLFILLLAASEAMAADLTVNISHRPATAGEIGCSLYAEADTAAFPMGAPSAPQQWQRISDGTLRCQFNGLAAGRYAVSVSQDDNGNRRTDTNFLGIPKEDWGVSNNVRPLMRAPTFEEAAIQVGEAAAVNIDVRIKP